MKLIVQTALITLICAAAHAAKLPGDIWIAENRQNKLALVVGMQVGAEGTSARAEQLDIDRECKGEGLFGKITRKGSNALFQQELAALSALGSEQLSEGITVLYEDYRNRAIPLFDMAIVAAGAIGGDPPDLTEEKLQRLRKK